MNNKAIESILQTLGVRIEIPVKLFLISGDALALLDIEFIGDNISARKAHEAFVHIANEMKIHDEFVALERSISLPDGSLERSIRLGSFGNLDVYIVDAYSITLSKIERALDIDIDDILFLLERGYVGFEKLRQITEGELPQAGELNIDRSKMLKHFAIIRERSGL